MLSEHEKGHNLSLQLKKLMASYQSGDEQAATGIRQTIKNYLELLERHIAKENNILLPMLPEKLSTDLTPLNYHEDRSVLIIEMVIGDGGVIQDATIYRARVRNQAKLAYNTVGPPGWKTRGPCRRPWRRLRVWPRISDSRTGWRSRIRSRSKCSWSSRKPPTRSALTICL
jgi:hypothetical protein